MKVVGTYGVPKTRTPEEERAQLEKLAALAWKLQAHTEALRRQIDAMTAREGVRDEGAEDDRGEGAMEREGVDVEGARARSEVRAVRRDGEVRGGAGAADEDDELELEIDLDLDGWDDEKDDPFEDVATRREVPAPSPCGQCGAPPGRAHRGGCPRAATLKNVVPERAMSLAARPPVSDVKQGSWLHRLWRSLGNA